MLQLGSDSSVSIGGLFFPRLQLFSVFKPRLEAEVKKIYFLKVAVTSYFPNASGSEGWTYAPNTAQPGKKSAKYSFIIVLFKVIKKLWVLRSSLWGFSLPYVSLTWHDLCTGFWLKKAAPEAFETKKINV